MDIWSPISAFATAIGVLIATIGLYGVYLQLRQSKRALGVTILRDLEKQFDTDMLKTRLEVATYLLRKKPDEEPASACEDLLDFFDSMGIYQEKGTIDLEVTWVTFYYWLGHYWQFLKNDVERLEKKFGGVNYYKNAERIYSRLTQFGRKRRKLPVEADYFTPAELERFLKDEIEVCSSRLSEKKIVAEKQALEINSLSPTMTFRLGRKQFWVGIKDIN